MPADRDKDGRFPFSTSLPRKSIQRTTLLALIVLVAFSTYLFIFPNPFTLAPRTDLFSRPTLLAATAAAAAAASSSSQRIRPSETGANRPPQLFLDPSQELAAVTSFLASHYQNVIPLSVDPSLPIDPDVVLDFDTRGPRALDELHALLLDVWVQNPVVLYAKLYNSASREIRSLLSDMHLRPQATIFNVDQRDDAAVLTPLLHRLTGTSELPILLINGKPVGSLQQIRTLNESGELRRMITQAGAVIDGSLKKKKGNRK